MQSEKSNDKVCEICEKLERWLLRITLLILLALSLGKVVWNEIQKSHEPPPVEHPTSVKAK
jgi:hypothetical protein